MDVFNKQPNEVLDYTIDLATNWMVSGDTVSGTTAIASPSGLSLTVTQATTTTPKIWVSNGTDGATYQITATVTTTGGRTKEVEFKIAVKEL